MGRLKRHFKTFRVRVTILLVAGMLFGGVIGDYLIYRFALDANLQQLRERLKVIAQTCALLVDADLLGQVPLDPEGRRTEAYRAVAERLEQLRRRNPPIRYIYTMALTDEPGIWQFIVDPTPPEEEKEKGLSSDPGERYDVTPFPEMMRAFEGPTADREIGRDAWGAMLSGYAPIRDRNGKVFAILGVDMMADDVYATQREFGRRGFLIVLLGLALSLFLGMVISRSVTTPVRKLVDATRSIARNDLGHEVEIDGPEEIDELARSFNEMARNLEASRQKLRTYFCGVVQALVRILEAKDSYTMGHSERVASYAEKIASKVGLPEERIQLLKEAALLHDIGKLGIQENILNKMDKLTEDEWELLTRHPVVGEEILRPVLLDEELLMVTRRHHERFDGMGYPDRVGGQDIGLLAQIVSIADAYDAMTTRRVYRPSMTTDEAIDELRRNMATQFNPVIVEVFVRILEEEGALPLAGAAIEH